MKRAMERKEQEKKKSQNIEYVSGGTQVGTLPTPKINFPIPAIHIAFTVVVFPCLLLAYFGQAAYLMNNKKHVCDAFYHSIPDGIYWPMFIVATLAAVVASQATISATFSIIKQALAPGCFPRVKVIHTSKNFLGQIYILDINWILLILCIAVTAGFQVQSPIGNAYDLFYMRQNSVYLSFDRNSSCICHAGDNISHDFNHVTSMALPLDSCLLATGKFPRSELH